MAFADRRRRAAAEDVGAAFVRADVLRDRLFSPLTRAPSSAKLRMERFGRRGVLQTPLRAAL